MNSKSKGIARFWRILALMLLLLGETQIGRAVVPRPVLATNALTGEVTTNLSIEIPECRPAKPAVGVKAWWYAFWWDLKDDFYYGVPDVLKNEQPTLILCG